jgi:hypothetical protein
MTGFGLHEQYSGLLSVLPRKEVIHPQLPLRMPCYDFVPVTGPTVAPALKQDLWVLPAPLT